MSFHIANGNKDEAVSIMREAAKWLVDIEKPMWDINDLTPENISNPTREFYVLWENEESIAAMILSFEDRFFWSHIEPNTSGFIHKLSVRRKYAGKGYAEIMVKHAKNVCLDKGIKYLRLDCDPHRAGLLKFYEACGFTLVEMKQLNTPKLGLIDWAMFEMQLA